MTQRIYIGNLPFNAQEADVRRLFETHGTVEAVELITDRNSGRPRGFGFVEMADGMAEAIEALNEITLDGRQLTVAEAKSPGRRPSNPPTDALLSASNLQLLHSRLFSPDTAASLN